MVKNSEGSVAKWEKHEWVSIAAEDVCGQIRKVTNWKAAHPDGIRVFWLKRLKF